MNRMDRLNQLFKREIGRLILMGDLSDPRLRLVTITYADVSKDLSVAHVGFSVMIDGEKAVEEARQGLMSARGRIRSLLASRIDIRHIPEIRFVHDGSIAEAMRMEETLEEIRQEREGKEHEEEPS
ncbi:MAG: 30S ribosome-binding factor RbfA [Elusimicrobia bacterium]|nr:30S ribosome-binding factor RbfA [Elusimicrobiota bacterium]